MKKKADINNYARNGRHIQILNFLFSFNAGIINVFLAIPFFYHCIIPIQPFSVELIGAGLWLLSIIGEGISDWQLQQFKKTLQTKGKSVNMDCGIIHDTQTTSFN